MFVKVTHSGPRSYVQLVEAYRDDAGRPKQRTVATLGRLDQLTELDSVVSGLLRVTGKSAPAAAPTPMVSFESARDFGDVWALTELWNSLGFDQLRRIFRRTRHAIDVEALNAFLAGEQMEISNGYGVYKDKAFRIAHMGEAQESDLDRLFGAIERFLIEAKVAA